MHLRFRYEMLGAHTHIRVFMGPDSEHLANCGSLDFRNEEFEHFRDAIHLHYENGLNIDFVEESGNTCRHSAWNSSIGEHCPDCGVQLLRIQR